MRKRQAKKRPLLPDPKFNDQLVTRFVNNLMWDGKKSVAFKVFYDAIDIVEQKKNNDEKTALEVWKVSMAMKWLLGYARKRNENSMAQKLAAEIIAASKEEGAAVKKKMDTHRMAEANKAFSHFRF